MITSPGDALLIAVCKVDKEETVIVAAESRPDINKERVPHSRN
jgi:hypothetical protein